MMYPFPLGHTALLAVAAMLGLAIDARCADSSTAQPALAGTLVCVGDSITEGQPREQVGPDNYVVLLGKYAAEEKLDLQVKNEGRSGWTTQMYLDHTAAVVASMPADATVITILLGTNDTRFGTSTYQMVKQTVANLRKLMALYHAKAPEARFVVMAAPAIYPDKLPQNLRAANYNERSPAKVEALRNAYERMAAEDGLQFIDLSALPSKANSLEGVHPSAAGQKELADKIWAELKKGK